MGFGGKVLAAARRLCGGCVEGGAPGYTRESVHRLIRCGSNGEWMEMQRTVDRSPEVARTVLEACTVEANLPPGRVGFWLSYVSSRYRMDDLLGPLL